MAVLYFRIKIGEVKRKLFSIKIIVNIKNIRRINERVKIYFIISSFIRTLVTKVSTTMKKLDASITQSINCKYIQNLFNEFFIFYIWIIIIFINITILFNLILLFYTLSSYLLFYSHYHFHYSVYQEFLHLLP